MGPMGPAQSASHLKHSNMPEAAWRGASLPSIPPPDYRLVGRLQRCACLRDGRPSRHSMSAAALSEVGSWGSLALVELSPLCANTFRRQQGVNLSTKMTILGHAFLIF